MFGKRFLVSSLVVVAGLLLFAGCTSGKQTNPTATANATATATVATNATATVQPSATSSTTATATPSTGAPTPPEIAIISPQDGQVISTGAVRVVVSAPDDATVAINGAVADANVDGTFSSDVVLGDGTNIIDVTAAGIDGGTAQQSVSVFVFDQGDSPNLAITGPADGFISSNPYVTITGATDLDASVAVNGTPVQVNQYGIFGSTIALDSGPNLVEVAAVGSDGQQGIQDITIFYQQ